MLGEVLCLRLNPGHHDDHLNRSLQRRGLAASPWWYPMITVPLRHNREHILEHPTAPPCLTHRPCDAKKWYDAGIVCTHRGQRSARSWAPEHELSQRLDLCFLMLPVSYCPPASNVGGKHLWQLRGGVQGMACV